MFKGSNYDEEYEGFDGECEDAGAVRTRRQEAYRCKLGDAAMLEQRRNKRRRRDNYGGYYGGYRNEEPLSNSG
jgi:hypothetical protein